MRSTSDLTDPSGSNFGSFCREVVNGIHVVSGMAVLDVFREENRRRLGEVATKQKRTDLLTVCEQPSVLLPKQLISFVLMRLR
jgi:hypothetical protein